MLWQDYHLPTSLGEALELLASYHGEARIVGGGTDLILEIQQGHRPPVKALVDVTRITGANEIQREGEYIIIGCGVTHSQIVESALIQQYGTALAEGCGVIGGPQVRNVATLAGNVAHALPAGDGTISLLALGGEAQISRLETFEVLQTSKVFDSTLFVLCFSAAISPPPPRRFPVHRRYTSMRHRSVCRAAAARTTSSA